VGPDDADGLVWSDARAVDALRSTLDDADHIRWVQLPFAGIENFVEHLDHDRVWTCGKGVYAEPVAEMALALSVAGLRHVAAYAKASEWSAPAGRNLLNGNVTILGGGGITESLVRLLQPWNCRVTVVRSHVQAMDGVDDVLEADRYADALPGADLVVLCTPLGVYRQIAEAMAPGLKPGCIVTDVGSVKQSVIVDVAVDQGGCVETCRPTTHKEPTFEVDGVVHYCVANMPGAVPRTSTFALNNATLPFALALADKGAKQAMLDNPHLLAGLNVHRGMVTYADVARDLGYDYVPAVEALKTA